MTGSKRPASPTSPGASKKARPEIVKRLSTSAAPLPIGVPGSASPAKRQVIEVLNTPTISSPVPQTSGSVAEEQNSGDDHGEEHLAEQQQVDAVPADADVEMGEAKERGANEAPHSAEAAADLSKTEDSASRPEEAASAAKDEGQAETSDVPMPESEPSGEKDVEMADAAEPAPEPAVETPTTAEVTGAENEAERVATPIAEPVTEGEKKPETEGPVKGSEEKEAGEIEEPAA